MYVQQKHWTEFRTEVEQNTLVAESNAETCDL